MSAQEFQWLRLRHLPIAGHPVEVKEWRIVAGRDGMLMNLSGAHAPYFTRNIVLVHDSAGHTGVGEVPGGEGIRQALEDSKALLIGQSVGNIRSIPMAS